MKLPPFHLKKRRSHMEWDRKRTQRDYTLAFKLAVVEQVEKGEMTYRQAQEHYGIQGRSTVLVWLRKHGHADWGGDRARRVRRSCLMKKPTLPLSPEQQIKALEVQLRAAQEKAALFEAVVNVLKNDYGVRIVKKPLGKSSRKASSQA
jgi:transposase-like protein